MKALAAALGLSEAVQHVDRLADKWIARGWSEKKLEELDEGEKREWYDLRDSWERAIKILKDRVARFIRDYYKSPILRFEFLKDEYGMTGRVTLGFDSAQAKGYKIVDITYPQWFQSLGLETENLTNEQVEKLAPGVILTASDRYNLRDYFDGHLREAGFTSDEIFSFGTDFEKTLNPLRNFNENLLEIDRILQGIIEAKVKGPLTSDERTKLMTDFKQKLLDAHVTMDMPPTHAWWPLFENTVRSDLSYDENRKRIDELADMLIARERQKQAIIEAAARPPELFREPTEQDIVGIFTVGVMWSEESFFNEVKRKGFNVPKASEVLSKLLREGTLYEPRPGFYARTEVPPRAVAAPKLKPEDTGRLADFFLDKLNKAGVSLPTQYKAEFEKGLDINKTYEENVILTEKVADDIIKRVSAPPPIVTAPTEKLSASEKEHVWDYFGTTLRDKGVLDIDAYKEEFGKTLDPQKTWSENLELMDKLATVIATRVGAKPLPEEVRVKLRVDEGADPGTYVVTFWVDSFEAGFVGIERSAALKDYLTDGEEYVDFFEQFTMAGFEEEDLKRELAALPWPFSTGARLKIAWKYPEDVTFSSTAKEWIDVYEKVYTLSELEAFDVERLKVIAKIKLAKAGKNKAEIIDNILATAPKREIKEVAQEALKDLEGL